MWDFSSAHIKANRTTRNYRKGLPKLLRSPCPGNANAHEADSSNFTSEGKARFFKDQELSSERLQHVQYQCFFCTEVALLVLIGMNNRRGEGGM